MNSAAATPMHMIVAVIGPLGISGITLASAILKLRIPLIIIINNNNNNGNNKY